MLPHNTSLALAISNRQQCSIDTYFITRQCAMSKGFPHLNRVVKCTIIRYNTKTGNVKQDLLNLKVRYVGQV